MLFDNLKDLLDDVGGRNDEIEQARRLPADIAQDMAKAGLFRMMIPKALGGLELPPWESLQTMSSSSD